MSLQVWLPLTKDLRNQGLSDVTVTNNGATFNSAGKLGGCYNFTNQNIVIPSTNFKSEFINNQASLTAWVKVATSHNAYAQALVLGTQGTSWNNILFGIDINGSGIPIANASTGSAYTNLSFGTAIKDGTWHHVAYTYNAGIMKVYLDGVQKATTTTSNTPAWTSSTNLYIGGNSGGEKFQNGDSMNDVRVYSHCLSQMEIKELSKGLILHYKLKGYGQKNLWRNGSCQKDLTGMAQSTVGFTITTKDGYNCAHISGQLNKTGYLAIPDSMLPEAGAWYTISADMCAENIVKGTTNPYIGLYFSGDYLNTDNTGGWYGGSSYSGDGKADNHTFVDTYNNDGWHRVSCTVQYLHGGSEYKKGAFRMGYVYARDFTGDLYVKNIKFEKGKIPTPWCPCSSDDEYSALNFDTRIELDCSGFGYNSIFNQSFTVNSNGGGRYVTSIFFVAYNTPKTELITTSFLSSLTNCTISWWEYCTSSGNTLLFTGDTTSKYIAAGSTTNRLYDQQIGTSGIIMYKDGVEVSTTQGSTVYHPNVFHTLNEWHHFVMTGVNLSEWTQFRINSYSSSWPLNAYVSDLRIYATVLSASDVLELYKSSAYVDNKGNIYGYEVIEV